MNEQHIEQLARALWAKREAKLPHRVRMTWEEGTEVARLTTLAEARARLAATKRQERGK